jgi:ATP-dependent RNA helicase DBP3
LSPTRELAIQTFEVLENAGKLCNISAACFYGGVSKDSQYAALDRGVDILVATPGRLLDLMNEGVVDLQYVSYLVLDEADRMLDKGFERDIKTILSKTPTERQTKFGSYILEMSNQSYHWNCRISSKSQSHTNCRGH